jgi:hypothetical protein
MDSNRRSAATVNIVTDSADRAPFRKENVGSGVRTDGGTDRKANVGSGVRADVGTETKMDESSH